MCPDCAKHRMVIADLLLAVRALSGRCRTYGLTGPGDADLPGILESAERVMRAPERHGEDGP